MLTFTVNMVSKLKDIDKMKNMTLKNLQFVDLH